MFNLKATTARENEQKTAETRSSAQLRESTAEFECHLPLAFLLPFVAPAFSVVSLEHVP